MFRNACISAGYNSRFSLEWRYRYYRIICLLMGHRRFSGDEIHPCRRYNMPRSRCIWLNHKGLLFELTQLRYSYLTASGMSSFLSRRLIFIFWLKIVFGMRPRIGHSVVPINHSRGSRHPAWFDPPVRESLPLNLRNPAGG